MTHILDEATESANKRADMSAGLRAFAAWLDTHPGSPIPVVTAAFRIPMGERGARLQALKDVADWLGVDETERDGILTAERRFGPLKVGAYLAARDHERHLALAGVIRRSPEVLGDDKVDGVRGWAGNVTGGAA